jgi:hypothetical protein
LKSAAFKGHTRQEEEEAEEEEEGRRRHSFLCVPIFRANQPWRMAGAYNNVLIPAF